MLYIIYRLSIYTSLTDIKMKGVSMLKKWRYSGEEKDEDDISIYSKEVRESLLDDDELSPMEEAFMNGYEDAV